MSDADASGSADSRADAGPKTAILFPGQGSQTPGMGQAFYEAWSETRRRFDALSDAVDIDVPSLCFEADPETLASTEYTQPCVYTSGVATFAGLVDRFGIAPDFVAGHSLGHLGALSAAGSLAPAAGIDLVRRRGDHMERAAQTGEDGAMIAVLTRDREVVEEANRRADGVSIAAVNTDSQTVISGPASAVETAREFVADRTRARFAELDVGAAFHSASMRPAATAFADDLERTEFADATVPVVSDVTGGVYHGGDRAVAELEGQVVSTVDWRAVVETLRDRGVERFVELPPAGTLTGFVDSLRPDAETVALETPADAREVFAA
ncbi:ACP S-malonyltransferase [Halomicrobium salinisoli]|uniref:ACP S-malonyltransferase n=1 Tax=Halomicrobium salinisoli TaxID=2878391 RepID=UPI001CF0C40E|nr:ACP S-malonyltransferase [Halomicrobium salinisoli]